MYLVLLQASALSAPLRALFPHFSVVQHGSRAQGSPKQKTQITQTQIIHIIKKIWQVGVGKSVWWLGWENQNKGFDVNGSVSACILIVMCVENEGEVRKMCIIKKVNQRQRRGGFQSYSLSYKKDLLRQGPPQPELPLLKTKRTIRRRSGKTDILTLKFHHTRVYEQNPWICGCPSEDGGLFCWPCLLFNTSSTMRSWKTNGFKDMNNLSGDISRHAKIQSHLEASVALANFGASKMQLDRVRQQSTRNIYIFCFCIDAHNEDHAICQHCLKSIMTYPT